MEPCHHAAQTQEDIPMLSQASMLSKSEPVAQPCRYFTPSEALLIARLADLIIPPDDHSGGGVAGGALEFLDLALASDLNLQSDFSRGMAWLDASMKSRYGYSFLESPHEQQKELLDTIAYRQNATADTAIGVHFFALVRRAVVECFFSSEQGFKYLEYVGNSRSEAFLGCGHDVIAQLFERFRLADARPVDDRPSQG